MQSSASVNQYIWTTETLPTTFKLKLRSGQCICITNFKNRSDYYKHPADILQNRGSYRYFCMKLNLYYCQSKNVCQRCFQIFLQVNSALTFRKKLSEFLSGWKLLFWTIGENHLNHIRGDDCTLGFKWGRQNKIDREQKRKENLGLVVKRMWCLLKLYQFYPLLSKKTG